MLIEGHGLFLGNRGAPLRDTIHNLSDDEFLPDFIFPPLDGSVPPFYGGFKDGISVPPLDQCHLAGKFILTHLHLKPLRFLEEQLLLDHLVEDIKFEAPQLPLFDLACPLRHKSLKTRLKITEGDCPLADLCQNGARIASTPLTSTKCD